MTSKTTGKGAHKKRGILGRKERVLLMADTFCDERTIRRWERGEPVRESTKARLDESAKRLGIVVPKSKVAA